MKKRKSLISAVGFLLLLTGFILMPHSNPPSSPPVPLDSRFLIGAMQTFYDQGNDYRHYDSLGFNLWHNYNATEEVNGRHYPVGITQWDPDDKLFNPVSDYAANIRYHINIANQHNTSRLMLGRPKIEWLCGACPAPDAGVRGVITSVKQFPQTTLYGFIHSSHPSIQAQIYPITHNMVTGKW